MTTMLWLCWFKFMSSRSTQTWSVPFVITMTFHKQHRFNKHQAPFSFHQQTPYPSLLLPLPTILHSPSHTFSSSVCFVFGRFLSGWGHVWVLLNCWFRESVLSGVRLHVEPRPPPPETARQHQSEPRLRTGKLTKILKEPWKVSGKVKTGRRTFWHFSFCKNQTESQTIVNSLIRHGRQSTTVIKCLYQCLSQADLRCGKLWNYLLIAG